MVSAYELKKLLLDMESDRVEKTASLSDTDKICECICAFANDLPDHRIPGYLVIGVDPSGIPTKAAITERLLEDLAAHRSNGQILPLPVMNVATCDIDGVSVAVVEVFPSSDPPVRYKGRTHIRVGPRRAVATAEEERRLSERRIHRHKTWDARPCDESSLDDLSLDLFKLNYLPLAVSRDVLAENERTLEEQLSALRLFDGRHRCPTNAAVLLFGTDPVSFFPGAYVQFVSYDGTTQSNDVSREFRITGDLLQVLRELDQLAKRMSEARPVRQRDLSDKTVYNYPPIAFHEVAMNAVIHRNYEDSTTPVMINAFTDRIEILNPGSLFGDLNREQFPQGTSYRNPIIAEAAKTLGFVNRFGRGIAKARDEMAKNGSPAIDFKIGENHFLAILRPPA